MIAPLATRMRTSVALVRDFMVEAEEEGQRGDGTRRDNHHVERRLEKLEIGGIK